MAKPAEKIEVRLPNGTVAFVSEAVFLQMAGVQPPPQENKAKPKATRVSDRTRKLLEVLAAGGGQGVAPAVISDKLSLKGKQKAVSGEVLAAKFDIGQRLGLEWEKYFWKDGEIWRADADEVARLLKQR
jgi:hypothetical protein